MLKSFLTDHILNPAGIPLCGDRIRTDRPKYSRKKAIVFISGLGSLSSCIYQLQEIFFIRGQKTTVPQGRHRVSYANKAVHNPQCRSCGQLKALNVDGRPESLSYHPVSHAKPVK